MHFIDYFVGKPDRVECTEHLEIFLCVCVFCLSSNNLPNKPGIEYLPWFHTCESFFFRCQDDRESCGAEQTKVRDVTVLCSSKFLRFIVVIPFQLV